MCLSAFYKKSPKRALVLALALFSAAALSAALIAQYGFNLHPCELCMKQRYPYAAIIVIGLPTVFFARTEKTFRRVGWLCVLLLLADAGIATYHAGVELHIIPGPSSCTATAVDHSQTLEEMRAEIMNAPLVSCDQPMLHVLGLSMAAWNAIAAMLAALGGAVMLRRRQAA